MTTTMSDQQNISGRTAIDVNGAEIGKVKQVHVDDHSGQPLWVSISTGIFGMRWHLAPLYGSRADGDALRLAVTKDMVKDAPGVEGDNRIEGTEDDALRGYYAGYLGDGMDGALPGSVHPEPDPQERLRVVPDSVAEDRGTSPALGQRAPGRPGPTR